MSYFPPFSRAQFDRLGGTAEPNATVTGAARELGSAEGLIAPPGSVILALLDDTGGTVELQGSIDAANWYTVASGTNTANTPFELQAPVVFQYYRANITYAASGATISYLAVGNSGRSQTGGLSENAVNQRFSVESYQQRSRFTLQRMMYLQAMSAAASGGTNNDLNDINNNAFGNGTLVGAVTTVTAPASFTFLLPYGVLIGDSIAKGNGTPSVFPNPSSRLQDGAGVLTYDPLHVDQPGQLGYHLAERMQIPFLNQGIGSQTTTQVRARWERDVLGQTVAVGDTLPNTTIDWTATQANLRGKLPAIVVLVAGINDYASTPIATTKDNFEYFANSATTNRFNLIVCTIGAFGGLSDAKTQNLFAINQWLKNEFTAKYQDWVQVVPMDEWATLGNIQSFADLKTKGQSPGFKSPTAYQPGLYIDSVHPSKAGYAALADFIAGQCRFPVRIGRVGFDLLASVSFQPNYSYIDTASFLGVTLSRDLTNNTPFISEAITSLPVANYSNPLADLVPATYTTVNGTGANVGIMSASATLLPPSF